MARPLIVCSRVIFGDVVLLMQPSSTIPYIILVCSGTGILRNAGRDVLHEGENKGGAKEGMK